jgi:peptidoglycan hydrolase FlgJ
MVAPADLSTKFALDVQAVDGLRIASKKTGEDGLEAAARQFEALFLNMLLKSMRDATPQDSLMDSEQSRLYISMLDQQLSQTMSARGVGLAEIMIRQLRQEASQESAQNASLPSRDQLPVPDGPRPVQGHPEILAGQRPAAAALPERPEPPPEQPAQQPLPITPQPDLLSQGQKSRASQFQDRLITYAREASETTGIPAQFMIGQAALESGWGRRELRMPDGTPSHNLFGIKAGSNWKGQVVETLTTEYINGVPRKTVEKFRAYDSYAEAFRDYSNLLLGSRRYGGLLAQAAQGISVEGFAHGLQRAGYSSDPNYAEKLSRVIKHAQSS